MKPTVGRIVHCWPAHTVSLEDDHPRSLAGIITGVDAGEIHVHYFLEHGANGFCSFPVEPSSEPKHANWWWPPRV